MSGLWGITAPMVTTAITETSSGRDGPAAEERDPSGADDEDDEGLGGERFDEPARSGTAGAAAWKTQSMTAKVAKSNTELIGPKRIMNRRMKPMSQCDGRASCSSSTRSVGIVIWLVS